MATAPSHAAVRYGSTSCDPPTTPPSFDPQPPATERRRAVDTFTVAYDDTTGTVIATMRLYDPAFWGPNIPSAGFSLDSGCTQPSGEDNVTTSEEPVLAGTFGPSRPASDEV